MTVTLRPVAADDQDFLCRVYASTRQEEMAWTDWADDRKADFLTSQFLAQHRYYSENYTDTTFDVVLCDGTPAGRLYVARWTEEIRIVDISLLPDFRSRGIGTRLLKDLFAESKRTGKPVRIHVEKFNRALTLYHRLAFRPIADKGVYLLLERLPS
jgi:GNAT superfamily N-acetyltransferase